MSFTGRLRRLDLGPGVWSLETEDGCRFVLDGTVPADLEGARVHVDGPVAESMGFAMTGDAVIQVSRIRRA